MKRRENLALYALTMTVSGTLIVVIRVTETLGRGSIFCSDSECAVEGVLWSIPGHAAMLALLIANVLTAAVLVRARAGPSGARIAALGAALAGAVTYIFVAVVTLDYAWAGAFSGRLTPPPPMPLLPPILVTLTSSFWTVALMLTGVSIALTSLLLLPLRAPKALVVLGCVAGVAIAALIPSARIYGANAYVVSVAFSVLTAWAAWLAIAQIGQPAPEAS